MDAQSPIVIYHPWFRNLDGGTSWGQPTDDQDEAEVTLHQIVEREYPDGGESETGIDVRKYDRTTLEADAEETVIFIEEEYGYRYWMWHTGMTRAALEEWWTSLDSVNAYFFSPLGLPGVVTPAWYGPTEEQGMFTYAKEGFAYIDATEDCDPEKRFTGTIVFVENPLAHGRCHLHCDDDSSLLIGDKVLRHAGFDDLTLDKALEGAE